MHCHRGACILRGHKIATEGLSLKWLTLSFNPRPHCSLRGETELLLGFLRHFQASTRSLLALPTEKAGRRFPWTPCNCWEDGTSQTQPHLFHAASLSHLVVGCCSLAHHLVFWIIHSAFPHLCSASRHCPGKQLGTEMEGKKKNSPRNTKS